MKTLIVLLMATSAINAFFIGDRAREDFIDVLHRMFLNMQQGSFLPHSPPLGLSEMERIRNRFESLTLDEQERLKNYLFGERFPKPMPAHHSERTHSEIDEEKFKEMLEKWEAMTPEEREEYIMNRRREQPMTPYHNTRPHPHPEFNEEKMNEMREKWESMTEEERKEFLENHKKHPTRFTKIEKLEEPGEIKIRSPRSIDVKPLPEIELKRPTRPVEEDNRNNGNNLVRSQRAFQPIKPLPELIPPNELKVNKRLERFRPAAQMNEVDHQEIVKILDEMSPEEKNQFFRELFPNGMPIRPIGIVPAGNRIQPITNDEEVFAEYVPIVSSNSFDNGRTRIVDPWSRDRIPDIKEPQMRPRPEQEQPEWNNRLPPRPMPFPPSSQSKPPQAIPRPMPAQFQPIIPLEIQPILPLEFQPIFPLPEMNRPARPVFQY
ncbi:hypothetical protein PVAND_006134 [Polypedilum vanderplanki]|uniref:Uncharacterized protein n=1 Tax=Polypedilum vanderplanki TaxID=319348 RepID=A0A9J6C417_POLVA|nr:hypothetical protein PVAND_006134 [Polypedilum vanderplanki]